MAQSSFDKLKDKISNNIIISIILVTCTFLGGLAAAIKNFKEIEHLFQFAFTKGNAIYKSRQNIEQAKKDSMKNAHDLIAAVKKDIGVNTIYLDTLYSVDLDNNNLKDEFVILYRLNKVDSHFDPSNYVSVYKKTEDDEDGLKSILQKKQEFMGDYWIEKFGDKNYLMEQDVQGNAGFLNFQIYGYNGLGLMQLKLTNNGDGFLGSMKKVNGIYHLILAGKKYFIKYKDDTFALIPDNHKLDVGGNVVRVESRPHENDDEINYNFYFDEKKLKTEEVKDTDGSVLITLIKDTITIENHESLYFDTNCERCALTRFDPDEDGFIVGDFENATKVTAVKKGVYQISVVIEYNPRISMFIKIE